MAITERDHAWLCRAVDQAERALAAGDEPFGSVLVGPTGDVLFEDHNRVANGDHTRHAEFAIARWAVKNLDPEARRASVVYTSGEHCPMCAAAHGWVGLGRIAFATSSAQLVRWLTELGVAQAPVAALPINVVVPGIRVDGPDPRLEARVRLLHTRAHALQEGVTSSLRRLDATSSQA